MLSSIQILAILAATASAHIVISDPKPFEGSINSPIGDSNPFPCQGKTSGPSNSMELGSSPNLAFMGSTVHAGGSCQISLTYDTAPSASSAWKVLTSFEGGCPARGQTGNLTPESATLAVPDQYNFTVPSDIPAGKATLAWTWMNKSGGVREFYMNCAAVELTGTGGDQANFEKLPNMAVANVPSVNSCTTTEGNDYTFENPGSDVRKEGDGPFSPLNGSGCEVGGSSGTSPAGGAATSAAAAARAVRRGTNGKVAREF
ncbi:hypothetical protein N8I77_004400 [Diaporthe amygdali]|uniref:Lytic polysaccharide monooxygenase n=1 Tax=Phomopsis amygdali TaxID=1214568 RepID=A0AAD9W5Z0_PHOAM|nr:uncharacterized protein J7T55_008619 [Diaporthe amygdali]KAJ0121455.1 hypothetical protein J7T55_008619 [Diaporthe amygdali]KAK2611017.1 hypothetical protein N8I77_004400 [Diaporthe amygdali]